METEKTQQQLDNEVTLFAKTNFRNKQVPFGIKRDDRRKHMYVIGKTGMGKTTLMENMIIQDILNGHGLAFVDPHGDSVEKILNYIPSHRVNDVVYFNPSDMDFPLAFNILESVDPRYKHLVASGLMGVFTKIWANLWSARMEYILNNCILALLDSPGNTLLGISRMLVDKKYRKRIVDNVKDPMIRSFWQDEFANWTEKYRMEAIAPIQNKVGQFLSSGIIRNIVGQPRSTVDLRELMDNKKILLMNLSKGRVGEDNSALLGAMIITKLQLAALSRVDIPEEQRSDFYLYVDEFQNFATESFATILSEARKYRLNLIVGHQYIGQLVNDNNTKVRDAVFGNVGTIICFRVGAADAEFLEKEFMPTFTENDLVNIPKYTVVLRLMINGVASDPFTAETLSPATYQRTNNAEKIIRVSRERYANPVEDVEQKIVKWMGQDYHEQVAVIASNATTDEISVEVPTAPLTLDQAAEVTAEDVQGDQFEFTPEPANTMTMQAEIAVPEDHLDAPEEQMEPTLQTDIPDFSDTPSQLVRQDQPKQHDEQKKHKHKKKKRNFGGNNNGPENPIWNQVAQMTEQKNKQEQDKSKELIKHLDKIKIQPSVQTQPKPAQQSAQAPQPAQRNVLKPGESVKLDEI